MSWVLGVMSWGVRRLVFGVRGLERGVGRLALGVGGWNVLGLGSGFRCLVVGGRGDGRWPSAILAISLHLRFLVGLFLNFYFSFFVPFEAAPGLPVRGRGPARGRLRSGRGA